MLIVSSEFSIPDCYRFCPSREQILCRYLKPAVNGEPLSSGILIEVDIYGDNREPWNIFNKDEKQSFWVFTKLKKKSKSRFDRIAGCGCWLGRNIKEIKDASDKSSCQGNGHWIMHEFSLKDEGLSDYVICEIRNRDAGVSFDHQEDEVESRNKKRKSIDISDEEISVPSMKKVCGDHQETLHPNRLQTMISSPDFGDYVRPEEPSSAVTNYQQQNSGELPNRMQTMINNSSPYFDDFIGPQDILLDVDGILNGLDLEEVIIFKKR
ncbi:hypothetical protein CRYUN_Cryun40dG0078100 [Craigia yunnanensis]